MLEKLIKSHLFMICIILLFGLVFYFWFDYKNNLVAVWADAMIPLNPLANLKYLNSWVDVNNGIMTLSSLHFVILFYALLDKIGLTLTSSQFLHVYFIHVGGALGMYYLASITFKNLSQRYILALMSAVLYMFSPATYNMYIAYSPYAVAPLILALFMDGLDKDKNRLLYALLIGFAFGVGGLPDPHPRPLIILMTLIILSSLFAVIEGRGLKKILSFLCLVIISIILTNSWFFLRYFYNFINYSYLTSTAEKVVFSSGNRFMDEGTATADVMLRLFHRGINLGTQKATEYNSNIFVTIANYLYPILAFSSVFFLKKSLEIREKILFFLFTALFFVTFAKGPNPPLADIYKWLLTNFPLFRIFRTTAYVILGAAVSYSILIPFTIISMGQLLKSKGQKIICYSLIVFLLILNSYPFFLGYLTLVPGNIIPADTTKHGFKVPDSYYRMNDWLEKESKLTANTIILPLTSGYEATVWGYYGISMLPWIINKPIVNSQVPYFGAQSDILQKSIMDEIEYGIAGSQTFIALTGARNILVKNDSYEAKKRRIHGRIKNFFTFAKDFGDLYLYKTDPQYFLPIIYTAEKIIFTDKKVDDFPQIVSSPDYRVRSVIFFEEQNKGKNDSLIKADQLIIEKTPVIEFSKINPTKYLISIHQAKSEFPIVFSETFNEEWKLFPAKLPENPKLSEYKISEGNGEDQATNEELAQFVKNGWISTLGDKSDIEFISKNFQDTIQNDNLPKGVFYDTWFQRAADFDRHHLIANGYANSWIINPDEVCIGDLCRVNSDGSYDFNLILEFWPQRLYYMGIGVSAATWVFFLLYFISSLIFTQRSNRKVSGSLT